LREFFLYWVPDECRLGVYDGDDGHCYETVLDRRARRELLRNIAESLVDSRWAAVLQSEVFCFLWKLNFDY
jgi:hypothetical protein